jgi:F-type H+-transporting ATPase subunit delta
VIEKTLAKRYAAALLRTTDPEGSTEEAEGLLLSLGQVYRADKAFRGLLAHPQVPRAAKKKLLRKAYEGRARDSFLRFLDLLVDKNRTDLIPELAEAFDRLADASKGVVRVKVVSWKPLDEGRREKLAGTLSRMTGRKILLEAATDASLRGGMRVHLGDSVLDGSVAQRLKVLGEKFRELQRR